MTTRLRLLLPILGACLLTGCPTIPTPLAQPEHLSVSGDFVHTASGMTFPEKVGGFQRASVDKYDRDGLDESAGYLFRNSSGGILGTVFVYPSPSVVSFGSPPDVIAEARSTLGVNEYVAEKSEITQSHPGAKLARESAFTLKQGNHAWPGVLAVFTYTDNIGGQNVALESRLYLFTYIAGRWNVKYRLTYAAINSSVDQTIDVFLEQLHWTIKGQ